MIAHLLRGLRILGERWWPRRWLAAGDNWLDTGLRWGMTLGGAYVLWRLVASSWTVLGVVVAVVVVKALRAATRGARGEPAPVKAGPVVSAPTVEEGLPGVNAADVTSLFHDLLGGAPGVHLAALATGLSARYGGAWEVADVRALLESHGIPWKESVRDARKKVSVGVHSGDMKPLPQPLPAVAAGTPVGVVVAGQDAPTAPPTVPAPTPPTATTAVHGGVLITSTPDADDPHRTHIKIVNPARKRS